MSSPMNKLRYTDIKQGKLANAVTDVPCWEDHPPKGLDALKQGGGNSIRWEFSGTTGNGSKAAADVITNESNGLDDGPKLRISLRCLKETKVHMRIGPSNISPQTFHGTRSELLEPFVANGSGSNCMQGLRPRSCADGVDLDGVSAMRAAQLAPQVGDAHYALSLDSVCKLSSKLNMGAKIPTAGTRIGHGS